tara:strand:- start:62 stop:373 length:312 start_codon:yes stop_codon:yes gene_type:complete
MIDKPSYFDAVVELVGGAVNGPDDGPVSDLQFCDDQTPPTDAAVKKKLDEMKAEYEAKLYQHTRAPLYPDIGDQLDDLYKQGAFSDAMTTKIKKVKDDNPKPE